MIKNNEFKGIKYRTKLTGNTYNYGGLNYTEGEYDILFISGIRYQKLLVQGLITKYLNTLYGIRKDKDKKYILTHIPTGTIAAPYKFNSIEDISDYLKSKKNQNKILELVREKYETLKNGYKTATIM